jgi:hypothetical protein
MSQPDLRSYHEIIKAQYVNPDLDGLDDCVAATAEWFMTMISRKCTPIMMSHVAEKHPKMLT